MSAIQHNDFWLNPEGFTVRPVPNSDLWLFSVDQSNPVTLVCSEFGCVVPNYNAVRPLPPIKTDACSTRRWMSIIPWVGKYFTSTRFALSGYLHDDLYQHAMYHDLSGNVHFVTRAEADRLLYLALIAEGAPKAIAKLYYWGVRCGGWVPWAKYRSSGPGHSYGIVRGRSQNLR